jgi:hypothetical protein
MPNWKKLIVSGSDAALNSLTVSNGITGSLLGTSSYALTASFVDNTSTNAIIQGGNSFGTQALIGTNDNQNLAFETSGSIRMFIASGSGNVGIGISTPSASLHVRSTASITDVAFFQSNANGLCLSFNGSRIGFHTSPAGAFFSPFFGFTGGSNVQIGLGNTDASARLHVRGSGATSSSIALRVENNNASASLIIYDDNRTELTQNTGYNSTITDGALVLRNSNDLSAALGVTSDGILRVKLNTGLGINFIAGSDQTLIQGNRIFSFNTALRIGGNLSNSTSATNSSVLISDAITMVNLAHRYNALSITTPASSSITNGLVRGLFINPTFSGSVDYRAIETTAGNILFQSGSSPLLFVSESGNIGVGTSTPIQKIDVVGDIRVQGINGSGTLFMGSSTTGLGTIAGTNQASGGGSIRLYHGSHATLPDALQLRTGANTALTILQNNNVGIGTTSPSARLQVQGSGSTSSTTAFLIQNSTPTNIFTVRDDGANFSVSSTETISTWTHTNGNYFDLRIGNGSALASTQAGFYLNGTRVISFTPSQINLGTVSTINASGNPMTLRGGLPSSPTNLTGTTGIFLGAGQGSTGPLTSGSGVLDIVNVGYRDTNDTWAMGSGSATLNILKVQHRLNTSGTYSGLVRGIYYDPILVATTGVTHRAIETTSGDILFQSGSTPLFFVSSSGNIGIGKTTPNSRLDISGSAIITGSLTVTGGITGSLFGTASFATQALSASFAPSTPTFPFTGSAIISGSLEVTGSINGLLISRGNGNVSTNISIGATTAFSSSATGTHNFAAGNLALSKLTTGIGNTAIGQSSLLNNATGSNNTAIGRYSLRNSTSGNNNTAIGSFSLYSNKAGIHNTAIGLSSLLNNTYGNSNTAIGYNSLASNTTGAHSTAIGNQALRYNTIGFSNTAIGNKSLYTNSTGNDNTAIGRYSLQNNISGISNTAIGIYSLSNNIYGNNNTAIGQSSLTFNTTGNYNTAIGLAALASNISGSSNTAIGGRSLEQMITGSHNIAFGYNSGKFLNSGADNTITNNSIFIGRNTRALANNQTNQIVIGDTAIGLGSNTVVLGNDSITTTSLKGNVGIGTATPSERLHVVASGSGTDVPLYIAGTNTKGGTGYLDFLKVENTGGVSTPKKFFRINNTTGAWEVVNDAYSQTIMKLEDDGDMQIAGTLTQNSDESLKTNIQTIPNALEKTLQLRGVEYDRISTNKHEIGLIAQEVEQVFPELVNEANGIKSVAYSNIVSILIESIKELKQEIDILREHINNKIKFGNLK